MAFQRRQMVDVRHLGLKCASCGIEISELPFQPSGDRPVYCKECARQRRGPSSGGGSRGSRRY